MRNFFKSNSWAFPFLMIIWKGTSARISDLIVHFKKVGHSEFPRRSGAELCLMRHKVRIRPQILTLYPRLLPQCLRPTPVLRPVATWTASPECTPPVQGMYHTPLCYSCLTRCVNVCSLSRARRQSPQEGKVSSGPSSQFSVSSLEI